MKNIILEVEHHGDNNRALIGFDSVVEADELLKSKGFVRLCSDLLWVGLDKDGNEVSIMEPTLSPASMLLTVSQE